MGHDMEWVNMKWRAREWGIPMWGLRSGDMEWHKVGVTREWGQIEWRVRKWGALKWGLTEWGHRVGYTKVGILSGGYGSGA